MLVVNLLALAIVSLRRDLVWCVAASWICASLWSQKPKPFPVFVRDLPKLVDERTSDSCGCAALQITVVIFTVALPLALVASVLWKKLRGRQNEGEIRLPDDREEESGLPVSRGPREVDAEVLWG